MGIAPETLRENVRSKSVRKLNPHIFGKEVMHTEPLTGLNVSGLPDETDAAPRSAASTGACASVSNTRRKSVEDRLNKTERRWLEVLRSRNCYARIGIQDVTLRLANCVRYTGDFTTVVKVFDTSYTTIWETKGAYIRPDAWMKLKIAASTFPHFKFVMAQWKDNKWTTTEIKP